MFAIAAHADEREAHVREVERSGQNLPEGSYGRRNRQAIAARETRVVSRLRAVEQAYRTAIERDAAFNSPELARACTLMSMWLTRRSSWSNAESIRLTSRFSYWPPETMASNITAASAAFRNVAVYDRGKG